MLLVSGVRQASRSLQSPVDRSYCKDRARDPRKDAPEWTKGPLKYPWASGVPVFFAGRSIDPYFQRKRGLPTDWAVYARLLGRRLRVRQLAQAQSFGGPNLMIRGLLGQSGSEFPRRCLVMARDLLSWVVGPFRRELFLSRLPARTLLIVFGLLYYYCVAPKHSRFDGCRQNA